jgi:hypothetical protein
VHCLLDRRSLLASCVAVDVGSLAVVAETAVMAELVSFDGEVPETDNMASSNFTTYTRYSRARELQHDQQVTLPTSGHAPPVFVSEVIAQ